MERDKLLQEREKTHGNFGRNARVSQAIKRIIKVEDGIATGNVVFDEAIDMIALKLSRIASGQASFRDHWDDIAGYAKLASEECNFILANTASNKGDQ